MRQLLRPKPLGDFFLRRIRRTWPLYYLVLALAWLGYSMGRDFWGPLFDNRFAHQASIGWYVFFLQDFTVALGDGLGVITMGTWALALLQQSYFVLPVVGRVRSKRSRTWLLLGAFFLMPILRLVWLRGIAGFVLRADAVWLGAAAAVATDGGRRLERIPTPYVWVALLVSSLTVIAVGACQVHLGLLPFLDTTTAAVGYSFIALFYVSLLLLVLGNRKIAAPLAYRPLAKLGRWSYGIYLFHQGVVGWLSWLFLKEAPQLNDLRSLAVTCLSVAVTVALAGLSWKWLEEPLIGATAG